MAQSMRSSTSSKDKQQKGGGKFINWWLRLTAPPDPPPGATKAQRELAWRGQLASYFLPVVLLFVLLPMPSAIGNPIQFYALVSVACLDLFMFVLNRMGKTYLAGVLTVMGIEAGLITSILSTPGGLAVSNLPLFDLLVQALLVSIALLPPLSVAAVALFNIAFVIIDFKLLPHTAELDHLLATNFGGIVSPPVILQAILAFLLYQLMKRLLGEINRADSAEEIAELERRELERRERELELKRQLDQGIEQILQTHVRVANGDLNARAPLTKENLLWQIAYALNNLLARQQRLAQIEDELTQAKTATAHFAQAIHNAKRTKSAVQLTRTGTFLDQLIIALGTGTEMQHQATSTFAQPQNSSTKEPMPFVQSQNNPPKESSPLPLRSSKGDAHWSVGKPDLTRGDH